MTPSIVLLALLTAPGAPPSGEARALVHKVQAFYERTQDLEARFVQTYTYAMGRTQVSKGTIQVKKPGKIRWDYAEPSKKTIAVSGSRMVQYEPEENQAYVDEHFDSSAMGAGMAFLLGKGNLEKEFDSSVGDGGALVLTPKKPDANVSSIALTLGSEGEVKVTRVVDGSGNVNEMAFEDVRRNVKLKDASFELKLPADVRRLRAPGSPGNP